MKTISKSAAFLVITAMLFITPVNAQHRNEKNTGLKLHIGNPMLDDTTENTNKALTVRIIITSNHLNLKGATVKIYHDNRLIAALNNSMQNKLIIELEKDAYYVLEVYKAGYVSKSIMISTVIPVDSSATNIDNTIYSHVVSISLLKHVLFKSSDIDGTAPLIGVVYYDSVHDAYIGSPMINGTSDKKEIIVQLENWLGS